MRRSSPAPVRKNLITVAAAAEYLGVGVRTIRCYIAPDDLVCPHYPALCDPDS